MLNRLLLVATVILCIVLSIRNLPSASATEDDQSGFKRELYKVEVHESIMGNPSLAAIWRQYGEMKAGWRSDTFRARFPDESKYRYTFEEEYECRQHLAEQWEELKATSPQLSDKYLDNLVKVKNSRYFKEYVYVYFGKSSWKTDEDKLRLDEFKKWCKSNLKGPKKETRVNVTKIEFAEW